jgi:hypothetical protein
MSTGGRWEGIPTDRVVAVLAQLGPGLVQVGSGYLVADDLVLTARHCTRDGRTSGPIASLSVARLSDGAAAQAEVIASALDVAVLRLDTDQADTWMVASRRPQFGRVDRSYSGELRDCEAVGFPLWQLDPRDQRNAAELHGVIRVTEDAETGLMVLRDPLLADVSAPSTTAADWDVHGRATVGDTDKAEESPWGGLSGALVFYRGVALGVIVEHHPRQGRSAIRILPAQRFAAPPAGSHQRDVAAVAAALGLPPADRLLPLRGEARAHDGPADSSRLAGYLRAARATARAHPYAIVRDGAPPLTAVYMSQQVCPEAPGASNRSPYRAGPRVTAAQERETAAAWAAELLQREDPFDVLKNCPGVLVTGGPGTGKSSLLRHVTETLAEAWLRDGSAAFLPVLVHADALTSRQPFPDAIADAVTRDLGTLLDDVIPGGMLVEPPAPGVPWLIMVDGIDEVLDVTERAKALNAVSHRLRDPAYRFLLASRMLPQAEFQTLTDAGFEHFDLQPLTEEESVLLARRWFQALGKDPAVVDRMMAELLRGRLGQLARIPLIVTAVCVALADDPGHELPMSRADLYERLVTSLLGKPFTQFNALERLQNRIRQYGEEPRRAVDRLFGNIRPLTEFLARRRLAQAIQRLLLDYAEEFAGSSLPPPLDNTTWRGILSEVLRQNGCLLQQGRDFAFIHQTVMEYLAACTLRDGPRLRRMERLGLKIRAGRGESYALFAVSVLRSDGTDLTRRPPRMFALRRLIHARLVAAMVSEGVNLAPKTVELATSRLLKSASRARPSFFSEISNAIWGGEDERVAAAQSLLLLDPDQGNAALVQAAIKPDVADFNIFDLLKQSSIRNPATDADRDRGITALVDLASQPAQEDFHRILVARLVLQFDRERGITLLQRLTGDPALDSSYRLECVSLLMRLDYGRGLTALAEFSADPGAELRLRFQAMRQLERLNPDRSRAVLEQMAFDPGDTGLARIVALVRISKERPTVAHQAIRSLSADANVPDVYRVTPSLVLDTPDVSEDLAQLSADSTLDPKWRLYTAERLVTSNVEAGVAALRDIARESGIRWRVRLRARAGTWIYPLLFSRSAPLPLAPRD